jgi:hypothetical protein
MSVMNDHINLVYVKKPLSEVLEDALTNPIKINYAIINKEFTNKDFVRKYFPEIKFKYIEHIDEMYVLYVKYKTKYLNLKQLGGSNITEMKKNYETISTYFADKNICTIDDISIYNILTMSEASGITRNFGGGYLFSGMIESIECVFKLLKIYESGKPDVNINEIGLTHYISDYFLNHENKKITDNFITFYLQKRCTDFLLQDYPMNTIISEKIPKEDITTNDITIMVVEKVFGDFKNLLISNLVENTKERSSEKEEEIIKLLDSILFQVIYTLYIFNKEFDGFVHVDLHTGNILIKKEPYIKSKKYKIERYLDEDDPTDVTEYNIEIPTFGFTPKIWDFATSYVGTTNKKIQEKDTTFISKYFDYKKDNSLKQYSSVSNRDLTFLLGSIATLSTKYHLPKKYISELEQIFTGNPIDRIFSIFLNKISEKYTNDHITKEDCDYYYVDKKK